MNEKTDKENLLEWLQAKLVIAEQSLRAREEAERVWRSGTDKSWGEVSKMHPSTVGKTMNKSERLRTAEIQSRIADLIRRDVGFIKAAIQTINSTK